MLANDMILRNPFRFFEKLHGFELRPGEFGAVLARAGVGKSAFLVQLALYNLLQKREVLHVSLSEPVNKVSFRYEDILNLMAGNAVAKIGGLKEEFMPHRFIMTFKVESFMVSTLEERLTDLIVQHIFAPKMIIIDGLRLEESAAETILKELGRLAEKLQISIWIAILTHRSEETDKKGFPRSFHPIAEFFKTVIQLQPVGNEIYVRPLSLGSSQVEQPSLRLDPTTMLVTEPRI